jgi:tetratricopeptide (TPR) repeat protein
MRQSPTDPDIWHSLSGNWIDQAGRMLDLGEDRTEVRELIHRGIELQRRALNARPQRADYRNFLVAGYLTLAYIAKTEADEHFQAGRMAEAKRILVGIQEQFAALVAEFPDQQRAVQRLGNSYIDVGNFYRATNCPLEQELAAWEAAVKYQPEYAPVHQHLGLALVRAGRIDDGLAAIQRAIKLKPDYAEAYNDLGVSLGKAGRHEAALVPLRRATELKPSYALAHVNLGHALINLGRPQEAEMSIRHALELQPSLAEAHCGLGSALRDQQRFVESLAEYKRGHELGSKRPDWRYPSAEWVHEAEQLAAPPQPSMK